MRRLSILAGLMLAAVVAVALTPLHAAAAVLQTTGSTTNVLIFTVVKLVISAGVGLLGTEWSKVLAFIQKAGAIGVAIAGALWGAAATFIAMKLNIPVPSDITAVTGTTIGGILTALAAVILHVTTIAPQVRRARLGAAFRF